MEINTFLAFLFYSVIGAWTPGPNNILAMATTGTYGFKKSIPVLCGISVGLLGAILCCCFFSLALSQFVPLVIRYLRWIGAAYILWLAWRISFGNVSRKKKESVERPVSFGVALILQFVNAKVLFFGITALSSFVLPYTGKKLEIVFFAILLTIIAWSGVFLWAVCGSILQKWFNVYKVQLNGILSLLLVYCAIKILY